MVYEWIQRENVSDLAIIAIILEHLLHNLCIIESTYGSVKPKDSECLHIEQSCVSNVVSHCFTE